MVFKNVSKHALMFTLALAGIAGMVGVDAWHGMTQKAEAQKAATLAFQKWKVDYSTLLPIDEKWKAELHTVAEAKDLLSVYEFIGADLGINADTLVVTKFEPLTIDEQPLDGVRACLGSSQGTGVLMEAPNFDVLLPHVHALLKRADMQVGTVRLSQEKGKARALLSSFCLLLRNN
ncbi:MAG: hypothetical protein Q7S87_09715 [Agitococcus sp.]|nr:hypothetical protein [Agitococcus sp.]MDO9179238.1 hypothetical protein [Agitococcus sp.]